MYRNKPIAKNKCPFCAEVEDEIYFVYLTVKCTMNLGEIFWVSVLAVGRVMLMELCFCKKCLRHRLGNWQDILKRRMI